MILAQIVAISANFAIGKDNKLLWHFSEDLKYFKSITTGKIMIMGRKTFDSFGSKPLPKRFHIVISRTPEQVNTSENVVAAKDLEEACKIAKQKIKDSGYPEEVMVIGGAEIYNQTLKSCDKLYITRINAKYDGDVFYPKAFTEIFKLSHTTPSTEHPNLITYEIWENRQSSSQKI